MKFKKVNVLLDIINKYYEFLLDVAVTSLTSVSIKLKCVFEVELTWKTNVMPEAARQLHKGLCSCEDVFMC